MPSAIRPIPHREGLPVPTPLVNWEDVIPELHDDEHNNETEDLLENKVDHTYLPSLSDPHLL